jgi:hypothetical protein
MKKTESPAPPPEPADQFKAHRQAAVGLETALKNLDALEADIFALKGELERTSASLEAAYDASEIDNEQIGSLINKRTGLEARLKRIEDKHLQTQFDVQTDTVELSNSANTIYQKCRIALMDQAVEAILAVVHPNLRTRSKANAQMLAPVAETVVNFESCDVALHPMATQPLVDIGGVRAWSQERDETMAMCRTEAKRLLELLPKLLKTAAEILAKDEVSNVVAA